MTAFANKMETLDLSHNLLTKLPVEMGNFIGLRQLRLAGNFWEHAGLPDEMGQLKNLR